METQINNSVTEPKTLEDWYQFLLKSLPTLKQDIKKGIDTLQSDIRIQTNIFFVPLQQSLPPRLQCFFNFLYDPAIHYPDHRNALLSENLYKQLVNFFLTNDFTQKKDPPVAVAHVIIDSKRIQEFGYGSSKDLCLEIEECLNPKLESYHLKMDVYTRDEDKGKLRFLVYPV